MTQAGRSHFDLLRVGLAAFLLNALASLTFTAISVATPYIGSALGVTSQDELWLTDAFLIALICVTPLSGFLAAKLGPRRLLLICAALTMCFFTAGALFKSLAVLTALCFLAGVSSGFIVPTTQAMVVQAFPSERRSVSMALWGAGTTSGILLGAALTGLALERTSWHEVFLIAWPVGLGALVASWLMPRTPESQDARAFRLDVYETVLLLGGLLALGVFINLGDNFGWFSSRLITAVFAVFVVSVPLYAWRARQLSRGLLDVSVLRNAPFAIAAGLTYGAAFFSTGQFQIDLLGGPLKMSPDALSLRSSLGAAALLAGVVLGGVLLHKIGPGRLVVGAFVIVLIGKYAFTRYTFGMTLPDVIWPQMVTGLGLGLITTPLAVYAYQTLPTTATKDVASLFALATQLGSGFGIALLGIALSFLQGRSLLYTGDPARVSLEPFLAVFWLEFSGTVALLLAGLLAFYRQRTKL